MTLTETSAAMNQRCCSADKHYSSVGMHVTTVFTSSVCCIIAGSGSSVGCQKRRFTNRVCNSLAHRQYRSLVSYWRRCVPQGDPVEWWISHTRWISEWRSFRHSNYSVMFVLMSVLTELSNPEVLSIGRLLCTHEKHTPPAVFLAIVIEQKFLCNYRCIFITSKTHDAINLRHSHVYPWYIADPYFQRKLHIPLHIIFYTSTITSSYAQLLSSMYVQLRALNIEVTKDIDPDLVFSLQSWHISQVPSTAYTIPHFIITATTTNELLMFLSLVHQLFFICPPTASFSVSNCVRSHGHCAHTAIFRNVDKHDLQAFTKPQ